MCSSINSALCVGELPTSRSVHFAPWQWEPVSVRWEAGWAPEALHTCRRKLNSNFCRPVHSRWLSDRFSDFLRRLRKPMENSDIRLPSGMLHRVTWYILTGVSEVFADSAIRTTCTTQQTWRPPYAYSPWEPETSTTAGTQSLGTFWFQYRRPALRFQVFKVAIMKVFWVVTPYILVLTDVSDVLTAAIIRTMGDKLTSWVVNMVMNILIA
jgi:hypothetical protein